MNKSEKIVKFGKEASWKPLLHIYKTTKIPWLMLILVVLISFGSQTVGVALAKYSSKIDTGTMTGGSFLVSYVALWLISVVLEYGQDLANQVGRAQMGRNVRKKLWGKMLRMPVSAYEKEEPAALCLKNDKGYGVCIQRNYRCYPSHQYGLWCYNRHDTGRKDLRQ